MDANLRNSEFYLVASKQALEKSFRLSQWTRTPGYSRIYIHTGTKKILQGVSLIFRNANPWNFEFSSLFFKHERLISWAIVVASYFVSREHCCACRFDARAQ